MVELEATETPEVVYTATYAGLYTFVLAGDFSTFPTVEVNGATVSAANAVFVVDKLQYSFLVWLEAADQLAYAGPVASLYGVRQGDGIPDA